MKKKNIVFTLMLILFIISFIAIAIGVDNGYFINFDNYIYNFLASIQNDDLTFIMKVITNLASAYILIFLAIAGLILIPNKKEKLFYFLNLLWIFGLNVILKNIFLRERPNILRLVYEDGYSFPSGHAMVSLAFYGFIIYLINKSNCSKHTKIFLNIVFFVLIILIGISRIYLGVHYATDIIGGFLISSIYLAVYIKLLNLNVK